MSNKVRTMDFLGEDNFGMFVYKCLETGVLYKCETIGGENSTLYSCGNAFDGDPSFPINPDLEIHFNEIEKQPTKEQKFNYQMLGRLQSDCEYFLGYGNRHSGHLYYKDEKEHIEKMKELYNSFSDDEKPEWLTYEQILTYEKSMVNA